MSLQLGRGAVVRGDDEGSITCNSSQQAQGGSSVSLQLLALGVSFVLLKNRRGLQYVPLMFWSKSALQHLAS